MNAEQIIDTHGNNVGRGEYYQMVLEYERLPTTQLFRFIENEKYKALFIK